MKIIVYGYKNNVIGSRFITYLLKMSSGGNSFVMGKAKLDTDEFRNEVARHNPSNIIFFSKVNNDIYFSNYNKSSNYDNLVKYFSIVNTAMFCKNNSIHFTYVGNSSMFSYSGRGPYDHDIFHEFNETDNYNFTNNSFSVVSANIDKVMRQLSECVLNLRTKMPIVNSDCSGNFITSLKNKRYICSMPNSITIVEDFIPIIFDMVLCNLKGTFNMVNDGYVSSNDILDLYNEKVDNKYKWHNISYDDAVRSEDYRVPNNIMSCQKLKDYCNVPNAQTSLLKIFENYRVIDETDRHRFFLDTDDTTILVIGGNGNNNCNFINNTFNETDKLNILNYTNIYNNFNIQENIKYSERYEFVDGDLRDATLLRYIFDKNKITHIVHFSEPEKEHQMHNILEYTSKCVVGTNTLLELVRDSYSIVNYTYVSNNKDFTIPSRNESKNVNYKTKNVCDAVNKSAIVLINSYKETYTIPINII